MKNAALIISFCFLQTASLTGHKDLYVSVNGNDENPGTRTKPFLTLAKAQNSLRELIASGRDKKITVWLDEGIYRLEKTLVFGPEDSDNKAAVTYSALPGKNVEISGGKEIKDWEKRDGGIWVAHCEVPGNYDFREMFIDGKRAIRARHPNNGFLRIVQAGKDRRTNFFYNEDDFPVPEDPSGVELILLHDWSVTRIAVSGIDNSKHLLSAKDTIGARRIDFFKIDNWEKNPRYFLENSIAFLDSEKEYFYDRKEGLVYLKLKEGELPKEMRIVVPFVESGLIRMDGDENHRISNVHFENIDFKYCYWPIPREGYAGIQACSFDPRGEKIDGWSVVPAAVKVLIAKTVRLKNAGSQISGDPGSGLVQAAGIA
jgi:hypothetical protein